MRCRLCETPCGAYRYCASCRVAVLGDAVMFIADSTGRMHPFWMSPACRLDVRRSWKRTAATTRGLARADARDAFVAELHHMARSGSAIVQVAR